MKEIKNHLIVVPHYKYFYIIHDANITLILIIKLENIIKIIIM